jgi:DNA (cytosine-5)-methyltransferase 1
MMLTHIDLFSGIAGFAIAAQWAGFKTVCFVEIDEYCQAVLRKNFPGVPICSDIKEFSPRWLLETINNKQQTQGTYNSQSPPISSRDSFAFVKRAGRKRNSAQAKRNEETDDFAPGHAVDVGCAGIAVPIQAADNGCEERQILIGNTAMDMIEERDNKMKSHSGVAEYSPEIIIPANDAKLDPGQKGNSMPITSSLGHNSQNSDSTSKTESRYANLVIDLLTAGVPCQPASQAGKRRGSQDDRWLWPEALEAVQQFHPTWTIFENPTGFLTLNRGLEFERLCLALEKEGYSVWTLIVPACAVDARHRRDRVWIVANYDGSRFNKCVSERQGVSAGLATKTQRASQDVADADCSRQERAQWGISENRNTPRRVDVSNGIRRQPQPGLGRVAVRLPGELDGSEAFYSYQEEWEGVPRVATGVKNRVDRLKGLGNSIQPQVAYEIIAAIAKLERMKCP